MKLNHMTPESERQYDTGFERGHAAFRAGAQSEYWVDAGGCRKRNALGAVQTIAGNPYAFGYIDGFMAAESDAH